MRQHPGLGERRGGEEGERRGGKEGERRGGKEGERRGGKEGERRGGEEGERRGGEEGERRGGEGEEEEGEDKEDEGREVNTCLQVQLLVIILTLPPVPTHHPSLPDVGSSRKITLGSFSSCRATASRRF